VISDTASGSLPQIIQSKTQIRAIFIGGAQIDKVTGNIVSKM